MATELQRVGPGTGRYRWTGSLPLTHADTATASRTLALVVVSDDPGVLRGIERFASLRVLEVDASAGLDLAPLAAPIGTLEDVSIRFEGEITGLSAVAAQALRGLALATSAGQLQRLVDETDWATIGPLPGLDLGCTGPGGCVVDPTPLHTVEGLTDLGGANTVFGPRGVDAATFSAALPPGIVRLYSAWADDQDVDRIERAEALRGLPNDDPSLTGFFWNDRVTLDDRAAPPEWTAADDGWWLELDVPCHLGVETDDGDLNHEADRRLRRAVRRLDDHGRVAFDTTADGLVVHVPDEALRAAVDVALHEVLRAMRDALQPASPT